MEGRRCRVRVPAARAPGGGEVSEKFNISPGRGSASLRLCGPADPLRWRRVQLGPCKDVVMPRRSRRLTGTGLERLFEIGGGILLNPWLRRQDEGRALAALEPVAAPLSALVRRWPWPVPRRWGSIGTGPGQFDGPCGVAISSGGDIVVCDRCNHRVQVFHSDGTFVRQWGSKGTALGQFQYPCSAAVSSSDEVFVADIDSHRIQVFHLDGSFVRSWGSQGDAPGQFNWISGVAVHGDLVLVSELFNDRIQCFGLDGTFVRMWGGSGTARGQLQGPTSLAVSAAGHVFVCDSHRVHVFGVDGTFRCRSGAKFDTPLWVALSSSGEVLVGDATRVHVLWATNGFFVRRRRSARDRAGTTHPDIDPLQLASVFKGLASPHSASDMAVTASGEVVVCCWVTGTICVDPAGRGRAQA